MVTKQDRIDLGNAVEEAIELVEQAQRLVDEAVGGMDIEDNYLAYGRYGFDQLLGNGNPYDSCLASLLVNDRACGGKSNESNK
jgi:hypothetical protein